MLVEGSVVNLLEREGDSGGQALLCYILYV